MRTLSLAVLLAIGVGALASQQPLVASPPTPNIVLFFVDDLGWSDLGYRNPVFESPNIDALANEGIDFQQAYIASPTCSPSRGTLLTGKHPARLKLVRHIPHKPESGFDKFGRTDQRFNLWKTDPAQFPCVNWLDLEHTTYAEALKELGYYNLFIGKWHLGHEPYQPIHQGFDQQIGTTNWGHPRSYYPPFFKNSEVFSDEQECYLTDRLTDEAVNFIEKYDRQRPFMLSFWYYNVHGPHQGREDLVKRFEAKGLTGKYAHYAAMVKSVDESVGRVRKAIEEKGIEGETIIIFLSDQGSYFENKPFRGGKRIDTLCEGGARVPFILHWPGVTPPGAKNDSVVQSTDLFPTLVEIAGGDPSRFTDLDGVSLVSTIRENGVLEQGEPIFGYRAYEDLYASVRSDDWKLLAYRSGDVKLYNIAKDIKEENDLAQDYPDKVKRLRGQLVEWEREMGVEKYSGVQTRAVNAVDVILGSWAIELPDGGPAWLQIQEVEGELTGTLLWSVGSAKPVKDLVYRDGRLTFQRRIHWKPYGNDDEARVVIKPMIARLVENELELKVTQTVVKQGTEETILLLGKRMPPMPPAPNLNQVKFGKPIQLFNGRDLSGWRLSNPMKKNGWRVVDGVLTNTTPKTDFSGYGEYGNLRTDQEFEDFRLTIEYNVPTAGNSGIYLRGMYEAQVVDRDSRMQGISGPGAVFGRIAPSINSGKPGGEWNRYELTLVDRHVTVVLNGKTVIDNQPVIGCTGGGLLADDTKPGPIFLQGDHTSVAYRNIVLYPVVEPQ